MRLRTEGRIHVYEAGRERIDCIKETISLNGVSGQCCVHHSIVGRQFNISGDSTPADIMNPATLPELDVLDIDAEGAEPEILRHLESDPRVLIIEVHPKHLTTEEVNEVHSIIELTYSIDKCMNHQGFKVDTAPLTMDEDVYLSCHTRFMKVTVG